MTPVYRTKIVAAGQEVFELLEGGVMILFKVGAPAELAEVSILHEVEADNLASGLNAGDVFRLGALEARVTAIGETAISKVAELGHVVISFNGAEAADRPGEICVEAVDLALVKEAIQPGAIIELLNA